MRSGSNFSNSYRVAVIIKLLEGGGQLVLVHKYQSTVSGENSLVPFSHY
jgi:hypothetical protein